jgi:hypothetical protein
VNFIDRPCDVLVHPVVRKIEVWAKISRSNISEERPLQRFCNAKSAFSTGHAWPIIIWGLLEGNSPQFGHEPRASPNFWRSCCGSN